jgi:hypothetical protein
MSVLGSLIGFSIHAAEGERVKGRRDDEEYPLPSAFPGPVREGRNRRRIRTNLQICKLATQTDNFVDFMFGIVLDICR